ncbi:MAG: PepSY-associated TM helix domain-containing protein [Rickettsiales bacterium]
MAFIFLLPLVILGLTGPILVFDHALDEAINPSVLLHEGDPLARVDSIDLDAALASAHSALQGDEFVFRLFVPRHEQAAILVDTRGHAEGARQMYIDPRSHAVLGVRERDGHLMRWIYTLHSNWAVKPWGDHGVFFTGVALVVLCLSGVINWLKHPSPSLKLRLKPKTFLRWWDIHRLTGVCVVLLLAMMALTGGTMAFMHSFGRGMLPPPDVPEIMVSTNTPPLSANAMRALSRNVFTDAQMTTIYPPRTETAPWQISWRQLDEPRKTKGMSQVWMHPYTGEVVAVDDALAREGWKKWLLWVFPLHNGEWLGWPTRMMILFLGGALLLLAYTGTRAFLAKRRKKRD